MKIRQYNLTTNGLWRGKGIREIIKLINEKTHDDKFTIMAADLLLPHYSRGEIHLGQRIVNGQSIFISFLFANWNREKKNNGMLNYQRELKIFVYIKVSKANRDFWNKYGYSTEKCHQIFPVTKSNSKSIQVMRT